MANKFISCELKGYKKLQKELKKMRKAPERVERGIIGEFKKRAPGWIATEVASVYNINKMEIKPSKSGGVSAGSIAVKGKTIKSVSLVYRGRLLTPTHFGMKPKKPSKSGNYKLTAEILKGRVKTWGVNKKLTKKQRQQIGKNFRKQGKRSSPKSPNMLLHTGNRQPGGTDYIPFQRVSQRRDDLEVRKAISMPQMVSSRRVEKKIDDVLSKNIGSRLEHYMERYMGK